MSTYRRQDRRAVAGTLLILGMSAFGLAIFYLDVIHWALQSTYSVHVLLPDAPGVRPGTPVTVAGVEAGRVTRIALAPVNSDSLAKAVLTLELGTAVRPQVRRDSDVRLRRVRLIGDPIVDVMPGSPTAGVSHPVIPCVAGAAPSAAATLARAGDLGAAFDSLQAPRSGSGSPGTRPGRPPPPRPPRERRPGTAPELDAAYRPGRSRPGSRTAVAFGDRRTRTAAAELRSLFQRGSGSRTRPPSARPSPGWPPGPTR